MGLRTPKTARSAKLGSKSPAKIQEYKHLRVTSLQGNTHT